MQKKKEELDRVRDVPKEKQFKNKNTDKIVKSKFEREIKQVQQDLLEEGAQEQQEQQNNKMINYETMCRILKATGFLP